MGTRHLTMKVQAGDESTTFGRDYMEVEVSLENNYHRIGGENMNRALPFIPTPPPQVVDSAIQSHSSSNMISVLNGHRLTSKAYISQLALLVPGLDFVMLVLRRIDMSSSQINSPIAPEKQTCGLRMVSSQES